MNTVNCRLRDGTQKIEKRWPKSEEVSREKNEKEKPFALLILVEHVDSVTTEKLKRSVALIFCRRKHFSIKFKIMIQLDL